MNSNEAKSESFSFLDTIVADARIETEWVDLLSQLEYVGFRKIAASVVYERVNLDVLHHAQEESLHAFLLKRVAEQRGLSPRPWSENPFSEIGFKYFQTLDSELSSELDPPNCYPMVSWAVEQRVLRVYPDYLAKTQCERVRIALKQIVAQEKRHGSQFETLPIDSAFRARALELEAGLWAEFVEAVESRVADLQCR